ncbi:UTP--glucose-1-phosphate uridylyltransferase [Natronoglycomyces albus]|uniref:UTP--glucose-1-phosphate uridylyltransferase n=2 Tax=Natronoglycomyces albus TaxID=2811108 RepID=A0A895XIA5_9ACTN|nr:UTP--glucose-1-phosphate uridylyltransferase [Natronoglycomyces albus]QSB04687.1 UTP--glucose-1-phosphate uridylyltransferase [Natronoglycomyces albus]
MSEAKPRRARKAVIPAAGDATRFLPATKAVPKELLPVVDKPVLQFIVAEAAGAGLDSLLVTARGKEAMENHFDARFDLEDKLIKKGDKARLEAIREPERLANVYAIRQGGALGLGHAVGRAASYVGEEPFAVLLADEFYRDGDPLLNRMVDVQAEKGGIVLALLEVEPEQVVRYGVAAIETLPDSDDVVRVTGMVEKPAIADAPSNYILVGRYVLPSEIFPVLDNTGPGAGGEIQLTDAMETMRAQGTSVHAVIVSSDRFDTGEPLGYLQTVVELASERDDLPEFRTWLREFAAKL